MKPAGSTRRHRASVVCMHRGQLLLVRYRDPVSGHEFSGPPGGQLEAHEGPARAAERETMEETGFPVRVTAPGPVCDYDFFWAGALRPCRTHWFRCELTADGDDLYDSRSSQAHPRREAIIIGVHWLGGDRQALEAALGYNESILSAVSELLRPNEFA